MRVERIYTLYVSRELTTAETPRKASCLYCVVLSLGHAKITETKRAKRTGGAFGGHATRSASVHAVSKHPVMSILWLNPNLKLAKKELVQTGVFHEITTIQTSRRPVI